MYAKCIVNVFPVLITHINESDLITVNYIFLASI